MEDNSTIPMAFLTFAASILADTQHGLSGPNIVKLCSEYAIEYDVEIPHAAYPFGYINKHTALCDNLKAFTPSQQYAIIRALCEHETFSKTTNEDIRNLKLRLIAKYSHLNSAGLETELNKNLIEQTRHWLDLYPESQKLFISALEKYEHGIYQRNLLDDLRLSLEKLLQALFKNNKSIENQIEILGRFIKDRKGSPVLSNMLSKLIDYYTKYQNAYVKHNDSVIEQEVDIVFEITSSFMKYLVKLIR